MKHARLVLSIACFVAAGVVVPLTARAVLAVVLTWTAGALLFLAKEPK